MAKRDEGRTKLHLGDPLLWSRRLSIPVLLLAAAASLVGLLIKGLYRDPVGVVHAMRGQDLVTVIVVAVLGIALLFGRRGSIRATLVWLGGLGYLLYTYTGAALAYRFNEFFLVYVALFSLLVFTLTTAVARLPIAEIEGRFGVRAPRRSVAVFLVLIAAMLVLTELAQIVPFLTTGAIPELITRAGATTSFVYVLDLGVIAPLCVLAAIWLWRRRPWGTVLSAVVLIKAAAMGIALLAMDLFAWRAGQRIDLTLTFMYGLIALGGIGFSISFLAHCRMSKKVDAEARGELG